MGFDSVTIDLTAGKHAQDVFERSDACFAALIEHGRDVVTIVDADTALLYANPAYERVFGYDSADLIGKPLGAALHPEDRERVTSILNGLVADGGEVGNLECRFAHADGTWRYGELTFVNRLSDPAVLGIICTARDVTERVEATARLAGQTLHDALTGLPNRLLVIDRLAMALARTARASDVVAVLFCDLDTFTVVNDRFGREGGDRVLIEVARRLTREFRGADTVARTGGDEFVVVCEGLRGVDDATALAAHIRDIVEEPIIFDDFEVAVSVSIGIATVTGSEASTADPMGLLRNADVAMYRAKRGGRARSSLLDRRLLSAATHRRGLESELRRALEADEFLLHYQPIYNLNDDTIVGVEALLRWDNPRRGLLMPDDFIGLAEETGVIVTMGTWVLRQACSQMRRWACELRWPGWMSVNFSARQVAEPGLASAVNEVLAASGLNADLLRLELTETALLSAGHAAAVELDAVRMLGVHVGMDDFGTGYASLTNLQQLPIDFLKIDRSFVTTLKRGGKRRDNGNAIVAAVAQIGLTLDLETIAEGVETEEQAKLLREYGCPYGQGYQFARPAPADEIAKLLTAPKCFPAGAGDFAARASS
jgi:diguanylate cyclase (GGDEF)-like protein/PAS domain S-box-containing protein